MKNLRLSDKVAANIYEAINNGLIHPGDWLNQEKIASEYKVSQVTAREALNKLVMEGLAERIPRQGVRVPIITIHDIIDIYEMRVQFEAKAWAIAAQTITKNELKKMRDLLPLTGVKADPLSVEITRQMNYDFHMTAIRASGRWTLIRIISQLLTMNNLRFLLSASTQETRLSDSEINIQDHAHLLLALENRDSKKAEELITAHIKRAMKARMELYQSFISAGIENL